MTTNLPGDRAPGASVQPCAWPIPGLETAYHNALSVAVSAALVVGLTFVLAMLGRRQCWPWPAQRIGWWTGVAAAAVCLISAAVWWLAGMDC